MAATPQEALQHFYNPCLTLILLDVWLGDTSTDGLDLLKQIRAANSHIPVVMMSGHGTIEMAVSAIKQGAYDFIEKPFQTDRLLSVDTKDSSHFEKLIQPQQWLQEAFKVVNEYMYARVTELQQILRAENENLENQKLEAECALSDLFNTDLLKALQRTVGYKMQMDISRETLLQQLKMSRDYLD